MKQTQQKDTDWDWVFTLKCDATLKQVKLLIIK